MKNKIILLPILAVLIASLTIFLPVQPVKAIGPGLLEGDDGFGLPTWTREITYLNPMIGSIMGLNKGDKFRFNITAMNNSQVGFPPIFNPSPWTADTIWGTVEYYNRSTGSWGDYGGGSISEQVFAGYNSTNPYFLSISAFEPGQYYCFSNLVDSAYITEFPIIPLNFTAANHTIVNQTYYECQSLGGFSFQHISPSTIAGTWILSYSYTIASITSDVKFEYTFNDRGIMTKYRYIGGSGSLSALIYEETVIESKGSNGGISSEALLLLFLLSGKDEPMIGLWVGLSIAGGLGGGLIIGLIIGAKRQKL